MDDSVNLRIKTRRRWFSSQLWYEFKLDDHSGVVLGESGTAPDNAQLCLQLIRFMGSHGLTNITKETS